MQLCKLGDVVFDWHCVNVILFGYPDFAYPGLLSHLGHPGEEFAVVTPLEGGQGGRVLGVERPLLCSRPRNILFKGLNDQLYIFNTVAETLYFYTIREKQFRIRILNWEKNIFLLFFSRLKSVKAIFLSTSSLNDMMYLVSQMMMAEGSSMEEARGLKVTKYLSHGEKSINWRRNGWIMKNE